MAALKILVALLFGYGLLKREGVSSASALFGAAAFSFSVFQTVYLYYPLSAVTALLPVLCWAVLDALDRPGPRSMTIVAIATAAAMTGGHPESVLHLALACAALLALERLAPLNIRTVKRKAWTASRWLLAGMTTGLFLSASAWIPLLEQIRLSTRLAQISAHRIASPEFPWTAAWALVNPDSFGNPAHGNWNWIFNYSMVASAYVGLLPLALLPAALFAPSARRRDRYLAVVSIAALFVAMNWTPVARFINTLPPFSITANDRLRCLFVFFAVIAATRALDRIADGAFHWELLGSALTFGLALHVFHKKLGATLGIGGIAGAASLAAFWLAVIVLRKTRHRRLIGAAAVAATVIELFAFNAGFNSLAPRKFFVPSLPVIDRLKSLLGTEPGRIAALGWTLTPNASIQYGLEDVRGEDPMALASYSKFFDLVGKWNPTFDLHTIDDPNRPALDFLNVRFLITEPDRPADSPWIRVHHGADGDLYENPQALPRFFAPRSLVAPRSGEEQKQLEEIPRFSDTVVVADLLPRSQPAAAESTRIAARNPNRHGAIDSGVWKLEINAPEGSFIASSQPFSPGWRVEVDGRSSPIRVVNGAFIGFEVPPGKSRVRLSYWPVSFQLGCVLAAGALAWLGYLRIRSG